MPKNTTTYTLFIAAPSDIVEEKGIIRNLVEEWNQLQGEEKNVRLEVKDWESHSFPLYGKRGQAIINEQVFDHSDVVVGLFWTKFGSPTGVADSGTEEEILRAIEHEKPLMLYFSNKEIKPSEIDHEQREKVQTFRRKHQDQGLYFTYDSLKQFEKNFRLHISGMVNKVLLSRSNAPEKSKPESKEVDETGQSYADVAEISELLKKNFKVYWAKLYGIIEEEENVLPNGIRFSKSGKNREELKNLEARIEGWESRIEEYSSALQEVLQHIEEFGDDEFKNDVFAKELWTVEGALKNRDRELDRYRHSYKQIEAYKVTEVVNNIIRVAKEYAGNIYPKVIATEIKSPEELNLSILAEEETLLAGVIGKGIRSEVLHKLYPGVFTLMTRKSIWGLYFLSEESDEFVVDDKYEGQFRTVHNWDYLYDHFTFYNNFIYQLLKDHLGKHNIELNEECKYGYVNLFLVDIERSHEKEISKLTTPRKMEI